MEKNNNRDKADRQPDPPYSASSGSEGEFSENERGERTGDETGEDLRFNEEADSFELDTEMPDAPDSEYQHPDPYDTAVPGAMDHASTYDEANKYTPNEYDDAGDGGGAVDENGNPLGDPM